MNLLTDPDRVLQGDSCGRRLRLRRRFLGAVGGLVLAGVLAGCGAGDLASPAANHSGTGTLTRTTGSTSTTTTTTPGSASLPECGAARDPFDPTGSPPPVGSAAVCGP